MHAMGAIKASSTLDQARLDAESSERSRVFGEALGVSSRVFFPVQLQIASGQNGSASTVADWQYDLYPIGANTGLDPPIATSLIPLRPRPFGLLLQPSPLVGVAYLDPADTNEPVKLIDALEVLKTVADPCAT